MFRWFINIASIFIFTSLLGQADQELTKAKQFRVAFYNVENLFDTHNDSLTKDEEYLPEGQRRWDNNKFYSKLNNIYKVLIGLGEWQPAAIVGLCEVENRHVLNKLIYNTPLKEIDYKIIHYESADRRGIDVALLYRTSLFEPDTSYTIKVNFASNPKSRTRDILYVKGVLGGVDTLHVLINHWPSRYGGYMASEFKRIDAAKTLKKVTDSISQTDSGARIIIIGDFNDGPLSESIQTIIKAQIDTIHLREDGLYNLMTVSSGMGSKGTLKYQGNWEVFDQIIVSGSLLMERGRLQVTSDGARIYTSGYLLVDDEKYTGLKPYRTFNGMKYQGGFSDHLPVFIDLQLQ